MSMKDGGKTPSTSSGVKKTSATKSPTAVSSSRRSFFGKAAAVSAGLVVSTARVEEKGHGDDCPCIPCGVMYGPSPAMAYEKDPSIEDDGRSADYYAKMLQQKKTMARLEESGYALDTKEEEDAKISNAFASFSYDANMSSDKKKSAGKGYGNKTERDNK
eukprot:CAMPEP_0194090250 /NCGR_PEP_ID=MMETSP0149-20130528/38213_1 /TAXON_ID=122233 /ORGANISM="Chaetoceros debilis, Strain MM31A-1" /LENGTH=159 /DNA_ID=CAMNT_0038774441 /DNA_START=128 /DNA_END=607 /DNA_ORIENTATION=+